MAEAPTADPAGDTTTSDAENAELVMFHAKECYVYKIPPRKSAASYRADEWDINRWAWEGSLKVVSKGEECTIRLEDSKTGELFAQAPLRRDGNLPVEAVIDSSRFFVLRIEDGTGSSAKHAFIGIGFRERPLAYDFQAALHDHLNYLNKKKEAEEMVLEYESKPSSDFKLKEGQTIHLDIRGATKHSGGSFFRRKLADMRSLSSGPPPAANDGSDTFMRSASGQFPLLSPHQPNPQSPVAPPPSPSSPGTGFQVSFPPPPSPSSVLPPTHISPSSGEVDSSPDNGRSDLSQGPTGQALGPPAASEAPGFRDDDQSEAQELGTSAAPSSEKGQEDEDFGDFQGA